jgi:hypothetical protein
VPVLSNGRPNHENISYLALYLAMLSISRLHTTGGEFMNENERKILDRRRQMLG